MKKEYNIDDEVYLLDLTSYHPCAEQQQPMSLTRRLREGVAHMKSSILCNKQIA